MPVHDWTRVTAGTFHDFHSAWIIHLKEALNNGLLPEGYYALSEQHAGRVIADILTLQVDESPSITPAMSSSTAVAAPPRAGRKISASQSANFRFLRRSLAIRHSSNHRLIALIEVVWPANKDRASSVRDFVRKAHAALQHGCHLVVVDLFPPSAHDPEGIHGAIWELFGPAEDLPSADKPLALGSYVAADLPDAYVEFIAVGDPLPEMPLFLEPDRHIDLPLESTYEQAYRGVPAYWKAAIERHA
ncbi:MAG TPA: DUF4058 family protein [Gemmataceae bacterium]|jgi:hypothetical protein|nr:DUF4058 family protein [Gemmataceae bacterium]